jgi:hypothetical protein
MPQNTPGGVDSGFCDLRSMVECSIVPTTSKKEPT